MPQRTEKAGTLSVLRDFGPLAITAIGLLFYIATRLPLTIFLSLLNTSPDELGVGYAEILGQSSLGVILIVVASLVLSGVVAFVGFYRDLFRLVVSDRRRNSGSGRMKAGDIFTANVSESQFDQWLVRQVEIATTSPEFASVLVKLTGRSIDEEIERSRTRRRLTLQASRTKEEEEKLADLRTNKLQYGRLAIAIFIATLSWLRRHAVAVVICCFAAIAFVILPALALVDALLIQEGGDGLPGAGPVFGWNAPAVKVDSDGAVTPLLGKVIASDSLRLLGSAENYTVLFDGSTDTTYRVPADDIVIMSRD